MTKKSKAEQVEEKVQDAAPAAEQAEQMEGADAARQPSEEELKAMLRGENRQHDEALGDAWAVLLGQNPMAVMPQVVGTVLHDGGTRPAWQWKRSGKDYVLMAWPKDQPSRAAVLMQADEGEKFKPLSAVPFLEGLPNDLTVEDIHPWSQGGGANVAVSMIEGKNPMWFYDPLYLRDKDDLTPGVTQTFLLSGLAIALRKALLDDVNITQGPQYEAWAAQWLAENPGMFLDSLDKLPRNKTHHRHLRSLHSIYLLRKSHLPKCINLHLQHPIGQPYLRMPLPNQKWTSRSFPCASPSTSVRTWCCPSTPARWSCGITIPRKAMKWMPMSGCRAVSSTWMKAPRNNPHPRN